MNSIPAGGPLTSPILTNGYLELIMLISIASLMVIFALMLRALLRANRERTRIQCPARLRRVRILFGLAPDGRRTNVIRCSVFGRRPITCGKVCLHGGVQG